MRLLLDVGDYEMYVGVVTVVAPQKDAYFCCGGLVKKKRRKKSIFMCLTLRIRITVQQNLTQLSYCACPRLLHVRFTSIFVTRLLYTCDSGQWQVNYIGKPAVGVIVDG